MYNGTRDEGEHDLSIPINIVPLMCFIHPKQQLPVSCEAPMKKGSALSSVRILIRYLQQYVCIRTRCLCVRFIYLFT